MKVTFTGATEVADHIKSLHFQTDKPVEYTAGQYIQLHLPHDNVDDRGDKRWFTLSSSPTEKELTITTRQAVDHISSFKTVLFGLTPGDTVHMVEPMGDFVLPKDESIPITFVAGGIGVTPMRSMAKWLVDTRQTRDITLLYAVNKVSDAIFLDVFKEAGIPATLIVTNPEADYTGETGLLSAARLQKMVDFTDNRLLYLSGPEPMVETIFNDLKADNIPESQLVGDYFPNYTQY